MSDHGHTQDIGPLQDNQGIIQKIVREVMVQREEILKAFIAKHGFEPDEAIQVQDGLKWYIRKRTPEEIERAKLL